MLGISCSQHSCNNSKIAPRCGFRFQFMQLGGGCSGLWFFFVLFFFLRNCSVCPIRLQPNPTRGVGPRAKAPLSAAGERGVPCMEIWV